ncbi:MAG TPA: YiiD C-terminal domain-containing protein [Xanthomonadaceae bacterium]|nr:YiiD C-terminal domain-containing protein [Xanthomonadaceae bacterium]
MNPESDAARLRALMRKLCAMPPVAAMAPTALSLDPHTQVLRLHAPLDANMNDKGCAFGGSMNALMTLAAWARLTHLLECAGHAAEVYVQDSTIRYLQPLYGELVAEAWLDPGHDAGALVAAFAARGRARARLMARMRTGAGSEVATFEGRFVAKRPEAPPPGDD